MPLETQKKLKGGAFFEFLRSAQEAIVLPPFVALAVRPRPGVWEYVRVNLHDLVVEELQASEYLQFKEELVDGMYVFHLFISCLSLSCCPFTQLMS